MKKFIIMLLCLFSLFSVVGCFDDDGVKKDDDEDDIYEEYAGTYNLYYMSGSFSLSDYEYYRIILKSNGKCIIEAKGSANSQEISSNATYEIKNDKIFIYSKVDGTKVTEEYDYVDGEIHMNNQELMGYTITAKFKRDSNVESNHESNQGSQDLSKYAGTYNLYYMGGSLSLSDFDYYRIILKPNGDCIVESKAAGNSSNYKCDATYEIVGNVIKIYTESGSSIITEVYDYVNGEIHMLNVSLGSYSFTAKFRRNID